MPLFDRFRRRLADRIAPQEASSRRDFFRHAAGAGAAALGAGLMLPEGAWAGVRERADRFGITPGTVVDARGRTIRQQPQFGEAYVGQIIQVGFNFAPPGWAFCDGQLLSIPSNQALFSLLGTTFGGDGETTFGLPSMQGRTAVHVGDGPGLDPVSWGQRGGSNATTLVTANLPPHSHPMAGSAAPGTSEDPTDRVPAVPASSIPQYADSGGAIMDPTGSTGDGAAFSTMQPYIGINHCIALVGLFPSEN